jgi:flagellum-specific peptidoglycan hydrolase FlgJ
MLPDPALKQAAMMYKNDPYILPMIISEDSARKQIRSAAQAQMSGGEQPKVVDQAVASMGQAPQMPMPPQGAGPAGLPTLPTPNMARMADGGIAGYPDDEEVGMAEGGVARFQSGGARRGDAKSEFVAAYGQLAQQVGAELGVAPEIILSQWGIETGWGSKTVGDYNFANIKDVSGKGPRAYDKAEGSRDAYKEYASPEAFAADYTSLIKRRFPEAVGAGGDVGRFTAGLKPGQQGGFATDKSYGKKIADTLTSLVPVGSVQAAPAQTAAVPTPAGQIPGTPAQPVYKEPSLGQKIVGTGETALSLLTGIPAMVLGGAQTAQQAISQGRAPTEQEFASNVGRFTYAPRTEAGQEISEDVAKTLGRLPPYIPGAQLGRVGRAAAPAKTAAEAEAAAAKVSAPRLAAPAVGATRAETEMAQVRGLAALKADQEAAALAADKAARAAVQAERRTPAAAYAAQVPQRAGAVGAGTMAMQAATAPGATAPDVPPISDTPYREEGLNYPPRKEDLSKEQKKDVIDATKAATPKEERKGLTNDDYLVMGLTMMANPGRGRGLQGLLEAVGTGGMAAVQSRREREKSEREAAKEASEAKYREALGKQAEAQAAYYTEGTKGATAALQAANTAFKNWEAGLSPLQKMEMTEQQRSAKYREFMREAFNALGLPMPGGVSSGAGDAVAVPEGVKVRQVG